MIIPKRDIFFILLYYIMGITAATSFLAGYFHLLSGEYNLIIPICEFIKTIFYIIMVVMLKRNFGEYL